MGESSWEALQPIGSDDDRWSMKDAANEVCSFQASSKLWDLILEEVVVMSLVGENVREDSQGLVGVNGRFFMYLVLSSLGRIGSLANYRTLSKLL